MKLSSFFSELFSEFVPKYCEQFESKTTVTTRKYPVNPDHSRMIFKPNYGVGMTFDTPECVKEIHIGSYDKAVEIVFKSGTKKEEAEEFLYKYIDYGYIVEYNQPWSEES